MLAVMLLLMGTVLRVIVPANTTAASSSIHTAGCMRWPVIMQMMLLLRHLLLTHSLVLNLETLCADLVAIHLFDGTLSSVRRVVRDEPKSLGLAGVPIDVDLGRYDIPKRSKGGDEIRISQIVGQMVDEEVGAGGTLAGTGDGDVVAAATAASSLVGKGRSVAARVVMRGSALGVRPGLGLVHIAGLRLAVVLLGRVLPGSHGHAVVLGILLVVRVVAALVRVGAVGLVPLVAGVMAASGGTAGVAVVVVVVATTSISRPPGAAGRPPLGELDDDGTVASVELDASGQLGDGPVALLSVGHADEGAGLPAAVGVLEEVDVLHLAVGGEHIAEVVLRQSLGDHPDEELVFQICLLLLLLCLGG